MHAAALALVAVLYAGSLVTPMEGPVKAAAATHGLALAGEPGGSKKLANFIRDGLRTPDVFISVDPAIVRGLGDRVAASTTFASTSLGIGWSANSRFAAQLRAAAAGKRPLLAVLASRGIVLGRTDPQTDPKGVFTIQAMHLLGAAALLGGDANPAQIFPEEDLLARIDTGEIDAGFFYKTEALARGLHFIPLPGKAAMSDRIAYTLAIMRDAPHPAAARAFAAFVLHGAGRTLLTQAGLVYR